MGAEPLNGEQRISVAEYLALERQAAHKSEFWQGVMYMVREADSRRDTVRDMAGGTSPHSRIAANLIASLSWKVKDRSCQTYTSDMRVLVPSAEFAAYPDVSLVCGEEELADKSEDTLLNPCLIAEILSPSTQKYDREKFFHYQQIASLQYYLLIHQDRAWIELFGRSSGGEWSYRIVGHPEDAERGLKAILELSALEIALPLTEIYRRIRLEPFLPPTK